MQKPLAFRAESAKFTPMSKDMIRYDLMVQEALKGVLRKLLVEAVRDGLPGEHHFYITFQTESPGVRLSQRMREKYPEEMTVVLQHQFWDLGVTEHAFEVGLSFGGIPERLLVPFDSITGFFDPSVKFGLKFELQGENAPSLEDEHAAAPKRPMLISVPSEPFDDADKDAAKAQSRKSSTKAIKSTLSDAATDAATPKTTGRKAVAKNDTKPVRKPEADDKPADHEIAAKEPSAQIVSLDAFRKKT